MRCSKDYNRHRTRHPRLRSACFTLCLWFRTLIIQRSSIEIKDNALTYKNLCSLSIMVLLCFYLKFLLCYILLFSYKDFVLILTKIKYSKISITSYCLWIIVFDFTIISFSSWSLQIAVSLEWYIIFKRNNNNYYYYYN